MKKIVLFTSLLICSKLFSQVWINEISYDMTGADADDFIEIVAPVNTDMSAYGILLANGNGDISYDYVQLSGTVSSTNANNGFGFFVLLTDQSSSIIVPTGVTSQSSGFGSIQNGNPDGILLLNSTTGATIHGIWYGESETPPTEITRVLGAPPGSGPYTMTGVDVTSLVDGGTTAAGGSISIDGDGNTGSWEETLIGTPGNLNSNQISLPVELSSFSAVILDKDVMLNWRTETEVNNYGFEVERLQNYNIEKLQDWKTLGFVEGSGNSNSPKQYSFVDENVLAGKYQYRLKQIDTDGHFEFSKTIEVNFGSPTKIELSQNYPNPFNPSTTISFTLPQSGNVKLTVYNIIGQQVAELVNGYKEAGIHTINFSASDFNSGVYFYRLETESLSELKKMILVK